MTGSQAIDLVLGTVQGLGAITVFLLALFIGVCVLLTLTKFRSTKGSLTVRNLDDLGANPVRYLPPSTPRGRTDQLANARRG